MRNRLYNYFLVLCCAIWATLHISAPTVNAGYDEEFSGVYSFGDSFTSTQGGWSDIITGKYGFSFVDNKSNFAFGGGQTTNLAFMLANYQAAAGSFDPNALYLVFMGPTDSADSHNGETAPDYTIIRLGFGLEADNYQNKGLLFDEFVIQYNKGALSFDQMFPETFADIQARANLYGNFIKQVSDRGGQYILVLNQFIDALRQFNKYDYKLFFSNIWANEFNKAVNQQIAIQAPNANIIFADTNRLLSEVTGNPTSYFTAEQIQGTQYDQGFFIDSHPTIYAHRLIAEYIASIIESPSRVAALRELSIGFGQNIMSDARELAMNSATEQPDMKKLRIKLTGSAEKVFSSSFTNKYLGFKDNSNFSGGVAMDLAIVENLLIGGGIKYFQSETYFAKGFGKATVKEPNYSLHGVYNFSKSLFAYFTAAWGSDKYSINRTFPIGIARIDHKAKTSGTHSMASLGIGYLFLLERIDMAFTPFVSAAHQRVTMKPYSEQGSLRSTSMSFKIPTRESISGEIGVKVQGKMFEIKRVNLVPSLTAIFTHEFNNPIKKRASGLVSDMPKSFLVPTYERGNDFILTAALLASHKSLNISLNGSFKPIGRFNECSISTSLKFNM